MGATLGCGVDSGAAGVEYPGTVFDAVVYGATPAGIIAAVRIARQDQRVLLISSTQHIGGMLTNGLSMIDALYSGARSPLYDEFLDRVQTYYRKQEGDQSEAAHITRFAVPRQWNKRPRFEAHVVENIFEDWVKAEPRLSLTRGYTPLYVGRRARQIETARFVSAESKAVLRVTANAFLDCSYEGDLLASANVRYVIGREGREDYGEPHAGVVFLKEPKGSPPAGSEGSLRSVMPMPLSEPTILAGSTGAGDRSIQAYNIRFVFSSDLSRSRPIYPPAGYTRHQFLPLLEQRGADKLALKPVELMHGKFAGPAFADFVGQSAGFPEASHAERLAIIKRHVDYGLGLMHFLQTDSAVAPDIRNEMSVYRLPLDEFIDNANVPREIYVREARRIRGRYIFTEHDATVAAGEPKTPNHLDSIAVSDWFIDSHPCSTVSNKSGELDGEMLISSTTRPSQIPFRTLVPTDIDNLLVPVCLSATHVGFCTLRVEPVWMHIAEAAACAVVIANRDRSLASEVNVDKLQAQLAANGALLTFFDDCPPSKEEPWRAAIQYLGVKDVFKGYFACPDDPLTRSEACAWIAKAAPHVFENAPLRTYGDADDSPMTAVDFAALIGVRNQRSVNVALSHEVITRRDAALMLFRSLHGDLSGW